jgi:hypothetical protein
MNQNEANRTSYDAPQPVSEDPIHAIFRQLTAENKAQAIRFVEFLKASQHIPVL